MKTINKKTTIMTSITLATILIAGYSFAAQPANADFTVIDFDSLADGVIVTNQFESQGAHFSSVGGGAKILLDAAEATSLDNILVGMVELGVTKIQ